MQKRSKRVVIWIGAGVVGILVLAGIALQIAIWNNGAAVLDKIDRLTGGPRDTQLVERASYGSSPKQYLTVYASDIASEEPLPVILFMHGGSWRSGDPKDYGFIARAFAPEGFVVVLAGYRLHPEAVYPEMLRDTAEAIAWTQENIAEHGGDPSRITVSGHSAGAYNVVMAALEERWLREAGGQPDGIVGVVGLAGPYDFFPFDSDSTKASFGHVETGEITQPINHARENAPPMLLVHGEADTLVKPRNTRELARILEAEGAEVQTLMLADGDHNQPLLALASPWRRNPIVHQAFVNFARSQKASVPVQDEMR